MIEFTFQLSKHESYDCMFVTSYDVKKT